MNSIQETLQALFRAAQLQFPAELLAYLRRRSIETGQSLFATPGLNHRGLPGMTVERILKEYDLAETIRWEVARSPASASALAMLHAIRAKISRNPNHGGMLLADAPSCLAPAPERPGFLASFPGLLARGLWTFAWPYFIAVLLAVAWTWHATGPFPNLGSILKVLVAAVLALALVLALLYRQFRGKERADKPDDSARTTLSSHPCSRQKTKEPSTISRVFLS